MAVGFSKLSFAIAVLYVMFRGCSDVGDCEKTTGGCYWRGAVCIEVERRCMPFWLGWP